MPILYEKLKKYAVPAASVEDFRRRYTKPDRLTARGPAYAAAVIQAAQEDFTRFGYTLISRHDSITGEIVAYYGPEQTGTKCDKTKEVFPWTPTQRFFRPTAWWRNTRTAPGSCSTA